MLILAEVTDYLIIGRILNRASIGLLTERSADYVTGSRLSCFFRRLPRYREEPLYNGTDGQEYTTRDPPGNSIVISKKARSNID
ncbi:hypothetical protein AB0L44_20810 [Nonomuraea wenchangensis]|uniref:hypothetical protein n=1 Tax=Nonomuraea wenchangensis TaxID=568860 RepID=UPI0034483D63